MAFLLAQASNDELKTGIVNGLEGDVNAALAALTNHNILWVELNAEDKARRRGLYLDCMIGYNAPGDAVLTNPYLLTTFTGRNEAEALGLAAAFRALQPGWFYAVPFVRFINQFAGTNNYPYICFQFYNQDPNGILNWKIPSQLGSAAASFAGWVLDAVGLTLTSLQVYIKQTANGITTLLPAAPLPDEMHFVRHAGGGANNVLGGNGHNINASSGIAATVTLVDGDIIVVKYDVTNTEWVEIS